MKQLKPYQVGENDIVAAENANEALQIMISEFGYEDIAIEDVEDLSRKVDSMVFSEDGEPLQTLGYFVNECKGVSQYLYGWE